jgi:hypothetical protein
MFNDVECNICSKGEKEMFVDPELVRPQHEKLRSSSNDHLSKDMIFKRGMKVLV